MIHHTSRSSNYDCVTERQQHKNFHITLPLSAWIYTYQLIALNSFRSLVVVDSQWNLFFNGHLYYWISSLSSCFANCTSLLKMFTYFWEERVWARRGRERGTEDPKQALHWQQRAWRRAQTHEPWDHDLSRSWSLNRLSPPRCPANCIEM